jgi:hypothetical protein
LLSGKSVWLLLHIEVKVLDWCDRLDELEASDNPFAMVVMTHLKFQEARKADL